MEDSQDKTKEKLTPAELLARHHYTGKLTPRLRESICRAVRNGTPARVAMRRHKLSQQTIANWENWAKTGEKGPKYTLFWCELEAAWAEWQSFVAGTLPQHVQRDGRVASDIASRIMPDDYGKVDTLNVTQLIEAGPILAQIAAAQRQIAEGSYIEGDWSLEEGKDAIQEPREAEGSSEKGGS